MSTDVYIERSRMGTVFYQIRGDRLEISGRRAMQRFAVEVELHSLSPRAEIHSERFWRPIFFLSVPGLLMVATAAIFMIQRALPREAVIWFAEVAGITGVSFIGAAVRWLPRLEVVRFKNVVGRVSFDVIREKAEAAKGDEFVKLLIQRIVHAKEPNSEQRSASQQRTPDAG